MSVTETPSARHIPELDGIRGIAILLVLIWHFVASIIPTQSNTLGDMIRQLLGFTWSGVDLFFVLSGFLIGGILLDQCDTPHYFKAFYARRISRVFPLYYVWLIIFIVLMLLTPTLETTQLWVGLFANTMPVWTYLTFTQNFAHAITGTMGGAWLAATWSLAVEEQFYLLLPGIIRWISLRLLPFFLLTLIIAAPVLRVLLLFAPFTTSLPEYVLMPCRMDSLFLGVFSAYLMRQERVAQWLGQHICWLYLALGGLLCGTVIFVSLNSFGMISFGYSGIALFDGCFLLIALNEKRGLITWVVRNSFLRQMGIIAYGAYVFHLAVRDLTFGVILNQIAQIRSLQDGLVSALAFGLTILIAWISLVGFERPLIALGHTIHYADAAAH